MSEGGDHFDRWKDRRRRSRGASGAPKPDDILDEVLDGLEGDSKKEEQSAGLEDLLEELLAESLKKNATTPSPGSSSSSKGAPSPNPFEDAMKNQSMFGDFLKGILKQVARSQEQGIDAEKAQLLVRELLKIVADVSRKHQVSSPEGLQKIGDAFTKMFGAVGGWKAEDDEEELEGDDNDAPLEGAEYVEEILREDEPVKYRDPLLRIHKAVFSGEADQVVLLCQRDNFDVNQQDPRGNTPLHIAVRLRNLNMCEVLIACGAELHVKGEMGTTPMEDAVETKDRGLVRCVWAASQKAGWERWRKRRPKVVEKFSRMPNFVCALHWEFGSKLFPFLKHLAPSDTYTIYKKGSSVRVDTTLVGFNKVKMRWQRGKVSIVFNASAGECGQLWIIDHDKKTYLDAMKDLSQPTDEDIDNDVATMMHMPNIKAKLKAKKFQFKRKKNRLGKFKNAKVGRWRTKVYELSGTVDVKMKRRPVTQPLLGYEEYFEPPHASEQALLPDGGNIHFDEGTGRGHASMQKASSKGKEPGKRDPRRSSGSREKSSVTTNMPGNERSGALVARNDDNTIKVYDPNGSMQPQNLGSVNVKLKTTVWLTEGFPIAVQDLLPVLEILGPASRHVNTIRDFLAVNFPNNLFPVKIKMPLIMSVAASVTFTSFAVKDTDDVMFDVPPGYKKTERDRSKKLLLGGPSRSQKALGWNR